MLTTQPFVSAWQNSNYHADHFTFRLCIPKDNRNLLQPDVWSEDIMISTWFRAKKTETETNQHQSSDTDATDMEDNVPTSLYRNAATQHPGSTSSAALLHTQALSLPVSAGMDVLHSSSSGYHRQRLYLPIQWSHRRRGLRRMGGGGLLPPLRCVNSLRWQNRRLSVWLAVSYGDSLWLPGQHGPWSRQYSSRSCTSATNCVDFAEKVKTIMVDCSNVLDNSDNDLKVINIYNS